MHSRLEGLIAVVTGGGAGIGRAIVDTFVREGARVAVGDVRQDAFDNLKRMHNGAVLLRHTDVASESDVQALVEATVSEWGRLDVLINNAGYGGVIGDLTEIDLADFDRTVGVLVRGVVHGYKHAGRVMKEQRSGSIVSIASAAGLTAGDAPVVYSLCKAAVIHLAKCAAVEFAPFNVRSNAICPGAIATRLLARALGLPSNQAGDFAAFLESRSKHGAAVKGVGVPQDVAEMAVFLGSASSSFVTGQAIAVDGGFCTNPRVFAIDPAQVQQLRQAFVSGR